MSISLCILTYNRCDILCELLTQVSSIQLPDLEIILVDNCSVDNTEKIIKERFPFVNYIKTNKNIGVGARNNALKVAKGEIIVTVDDDIFGINEKSLQFLMSKFDDNRKLGALCFRVKDFFTGEVCNWIHHRVVEEFYDVEFKTYEISEGAVAFRKSALDKVGYYPEYFFLSHEGPDLAFRLINAGFDVIYSPQVEVLHSHAQSGRKSWYRYYYDTRNQFLLAMRNLPVLYSIKYLIKGSLSTLVYSLRDGFVISWAKGIFNGLIMAAWHFRERSVLSREAMSIIRSIDNHRPSIAYMIKLRLFRKEMRL